MAQPFFPLLSYRGSTPFHPDFYEELALLLQMNGFILRSSQEGPKIYSNQKGEELQISVFVPEIDDGYRSQADDSIDINQAKGDLQNLFQVALGPTGLPSYVLDQRNDKGFYISVNLERIGQKKIGRGRASKRKEAEKLAALDALLSLGELK
jgi:dsRNA-specific ribonuclease